MSLRTVVKARAFIALGLLLLLASLAVAQEVTPKVDIFAGYSWLAPGRVFFNQGKPGGNGFDLAGAYNFNRWGAIQVDGGANFADQFTHSHIMAGPRLMARSERFNAFAEVLGGLSRLSSINGVGENFNAPGFMAGGGFEIPITQRFAWRIFQADYVYSHFTHRSFGLGTLKGARLQSGIVLMAGGAPELPVSATCTVQPTSLMAGEPVTANIQTANFKPNRTLNYTWTATGNAKVTPKDTTVTIDTTGLAPGQYTVTGTATDPRAKKNNTATCNATFTIQEPPKRPPVITCSASPTTVTSGDPVNITCQGSSPDNRPLTYNFTSTGGRVTPTNSNATLDTAGAPAGPITVTATVTDDRGLSAQATTSVNVEVPPPPPTASKLNEIAFPNVKKPWRVDNTAKAVLDDVALRLQREADAKAVIVGYFDPTEKVGRKPATETLAQQRAVNTKAYLVEEKGIDPTRIEVRTGTAGGTRAEIYLVPAGATFNVEGTSTFDESKVKVMTDKPAPRKRR